MLAQYRCHGWWLAALTLYYGDQGNHRALQGGHGSSYLPDIILRFMLLRALPPAAAAAARGAAVGEAAWIYPCPATPPAARGVVAMPGVPAMAVRPSWPARLRSLKSKKNTWQSDNTVLVLGHLYIQTQLQLPHQQLNIHSRITPDLIFHFAFKHILCFKIKKISKTWLYFV